MGYYKKKRFGHSFSKVQLVVFIAVISLFLAFFYFSSKMYPIYWKTNENYVEQPEKEIKQELPVYLYQKLEQKVPSRYLIIGDSIGQSDGVDSEKKWFNQLNSYFNQKNKKIVLTHSLITQPGSTVDVGLQKYLASNKSEKYELAIICYGTNDQGKSSESDFGRNYEKLITSIKKDNPNITIVTVIESPLSNKEFVDSIRKISEYYGAYTTDLRSAFERSGKEYNTLTNDGVHPNNDGYSIYSNEIIKTIENIITEQKMPKELPITPIYQ